MDWFDKEKKCKIEVTDDVEIYLFAYIYRWSDKILLVQIGDEDGVFGSLDGNKFNGSDLVISRWRCYSYWKI